MLLTNLTLNEVGVTKESVSRIIISLSEYEVEMLEKELVDEDFSADSAPRLCAFLELLQE